MTEETPRVKLWTPLAIGVYGLLLGYPCAIIPAARNWRALGMHRDARLHLAAAFLLSIPYVMMFIFWPGTPVRLVRAVLNVVTFSYLKAKLRSDIADAQEANPALAVQYRSWYSAMGWALLGLFVFVLLAAVIILTVTLARLPFQD